MTRVVEGSGGESAGEVGVEDEEGRRGGTGVVEGTKVDWTGKSPRVLCEGS